jgi:hypothetical protein
MIPALDSRQLKAEYADYAYNTRLWDGRLRAYREDASTDCTIPNQCEIHQGDCGAYGLKILNGQIVHLDGVPIFVDPPLTPAVSINPVGPDPIRFAISMVNEYGDESELSTPTGTYFVGHDSVISISQPGVFRVYAYVNDSVDGSIGAEDFAGDFENIVYQGQFTNTAAFSLNFTHAPTYKPGTMCVPDGVKCIVRDEEGYTAVYNDTTVWVSVIHEPTLYPKQQAVTVRSKIKQVIPYQDVFFVLTEERPELIRKPIIQSGIDTGFVDAAPYRFSIKQPALGRGVVCDVGVMYPSTLGVVLLTPTIPNGATVVTAGTISKDEWAEYLPDTSCWHEGIYYGWNNKKGFAFDLQETMHGKHELQTFIEISPGVSDAVSTDDGHMLVLRDGVRLHDSGPKYHAATWHSRWFVENGRRIYTAAKVVGSNLFGVVYELWGKESGLIHSQVIVDDKPFRIKPSRDLEFQVRIKIPASSIEVAVTEVHTESSMTELTKVS